MLIAKLPVEGFIRAMLPGLARIDDPCGTWPFAQRRNEVARACRRSRISIHHYRRTPEDLLIRIKPHRWILTEVLRWSLSGLGGHGNEPVGGGVRSLLKTPSGVSRGPSRARDVWRSRISGPTNRPIR